VRRRNAFISELGTRHYLMQATCPKLRLHILLTDWLTNLHRVVHILQTFISILTKSSKCSWSQLVAAWRGAAKVCAKHLSTHGPAADAADVDVEGRAGDAECCPYHGRAGGRRVVRCLLQGRENGHLHSKHAVSGRPNLRGAHLTNSAAYVVVDATRYQAT